MIDLKLFGGFDFTQTDRQTNERTDICTSRVAVVTENYFGWKTSRRVTLGFKVTKIEIEGARAIISFVGS